MNLDEQYVNRTHIPEVYQQKVQWGFSSLTQGLDQSSKTKGNKRQRGKTVRKYMTTFSFI